MLWLCCVLTIAHPRPRAVVWVLYPLGWPSSQRPVSTLCNGHGSDTKLACSGMSVYSIRGKDALRYVT